MHCLAPLRLNVSSSHADTWILTGTGLIIVVAGRVSLVPRLVRNRVTGPQLRLLSLLTIPIGMESGFSSVGSGALGTSLLFELTPLLPATVIGTDLAFGFCVSGSAGMMHALHGSCDWYAVRMLVPAGLFGILIGLCSMMMISTKGLRQLTISTTIIIGFYVLTKGLALFEKYFGTHYPSLVFKTKSLSVLRLDS